MEGEMRQSNEAPSHFNVGSISLRGPWLSNRGIEVKPSPRVNREGLTRHRIITASLESEITHIIQLIESHSHVLAPHNS